MQEQFIDRILHCADCDADFIFTAGEQLFFFDKQFRNDPKRCKPCKSRRTALAAAAAGLGTPMRMLARPETRTQCSTCGVETTVPFRPTQGRPVLCRQCFGMKVPIMRVPANIAAADMAASEDTVPDAACLAAAEFAAMQGALIQGAVAQVTAAQITAAQVSPVQIASAQIGTTES